MSVVNVDLEESMIIWAAETIFDFIFTPWNHIEIFTLSKSSGLVLSLLSDHIQRNAIEKDFQILIK